MLTFTFQLQFPYMKTYSFRKLNRKKTTLNMKMIPTDYYVQTRYKP